MAIEAFMLPAGAGRDDQLMALWHAPARADAACRGLVLYVHPFAEEMNKARRMAALQARALSAQGWGVLQIDLRGCGDSSSEFGEATWADWVADVHAGVRWLRANSGAAPTLPLTLWGLRAGCLVAADAAAQWPADLPEAGCNFVFWQPTANGAAVLRQFLRHAAAAAFMDGGGKGVVDKLRLQLGASEAVEVGGYRVHPALASGLEQARMTPPAQPGRVLWFEVSAMPAEAGGADAVPSAPVLSPAGTTAATPWRSAARHFEAQVISGPPFWQTAEIETAPALIEATLRGMGRP